MNDRFIAILKENLRLLIGLAVVIFVVAILVTFLATRKTPRVLVNNKTFNVMVAKTETEKQVGLSGRSELPINQGMLFVFNTPDYYAFWMKEMKFPIDIVYIKGDKVITVLSNVPAPSKNGALSIYKPTDKSDKVLELNSGIAQKYNIKKGSSIKVENL